MAADRVVGKGMGMAAGVAFLLLGATQALAVNLPPGGSVALPGSNVGGTVIHDELIDFEIRGPAGVLLYKGKLQDRVFRMASGKLAFSHYIRDTVAGLNGRVVRLSRIGFAGFTTDVDFDPTGLGTVAPTDATRSADGSLVAFEFTDPLASGAGSEWARTGTDADFFALGGATTIALSTGYSVTISTV